MPTVSNWLQIFYPLKQQESQCPKIETVYIQRIFVVAKLTEEQWSKSEQRADEGRVTVSTRFTISIETANACVVTQS